MIFYNSFVTKKLMLHSSDDTDLIFYFIEITHRC